MWAIPDNAQGILLVLLGMPWVELGLDAYKAPTLPAVLSLWHTDILSFEGRFSSPGKPEEEFKTDLPFLKNTVPHSCLSSTALGEIT